MPKGVLRFFFDYGAGGCLWAGDTKTRDELGLGPVGAALPLSWSARELCDQLDFDHSGYLNPLYPPDPSLWSQALCDRFNANVETLLGILRQDLAARFDILDAQLRYSEDPRLSRYLKINPDLSPMNRVESPTVRYGPK